MHCTNFSNITLPLNYFYFNSHYYFLCICTFLCSDYRRYAKRIPALCTITRCKYPFFLIATTQIDKLSEINQSFFHIYNLTGIPNTTNLLRMEYPMYASRLTHILYGKYMTKETYTLILGAYEQVCNLSKHLQKTHPLTVRKEAAPFRMTASNALLPTIYFSFRFQNAPRVISPRLQIRKFRYIRYTG